MCGQHDFLHLNYGYRKFQVTLFNDSLGHDDAVAPGHFKGTFCLLNRVPWLVTTTMAGNPLASKLSLFLLTVNGQPPYIFPHVL